MLLSDGAGLACRGVRVAAMVAAIGLIGVSGRADAARISSRTVVQTQFGPMRLGFIRFLEAGPNAWASYSPQIPGNLHLRADVTGALPTSSFVDYLNWRRSLDPTRFDRFHPRIAPLLASPQIVPSPQVPPLTPPAPQVTPPPLTPPSRQAVPEPSSLLTAALFCLAGGWAARSRRGRPAR